MHFKGIIGGRVVMKFENNVNLNKNIEPRLEFPGSYKKKSVYDDTSMACRRTQSGGIKERPSEILNMLLIGSRYH